MVDDRTVARGVRPAYLHPPVLAAVFVGGILGTLARHGIESAYPWRGSEWPFATFGVNLIGAFALGLLLEALARRGPDEGVRRRIRLLVGTGFCGAFTTYSTFALEAVLLTRDDQFATAISYAVSTVVLGAVAAWAGIVVGGVLGERGQAR